MFRLPKSLVLAAAGAGLFATFSSDGLACPPRGGGGYRPAYQPVYQPQYYPQACKPQIQVHPQGQPALTQQQLLQQQMLGQVPQQQGQVGQGQVAQGQFGQQPAQGQFGQQSVQQGQFGQAGVQQQQQQSVQQTQFAQPGQQQAVQGGAVNSGAVNSGAANSGAAASALNALGGGVQGQPAQGQQIQSQQTQSQGVQQQVQAQTQQAQPAQPQQAQAAPSAGADAAARSAADMALEALLGGSQATVAQEAAPASAIPTGDFSASVNNGTQVRLSLRNDNSFVWVASKGEKQSSFQGSFTLAGSALTLLRSDNQKLEGTLTQNASGFQLKLAGQNDAGLSFVRSGTLASR